MTLQKFLGSTVVFKHFLILSIEYFFDLNNQYENIYDDYSFPEHFYFLRVALCGKARIPLHVARGYRFQQFALRRQGALCGKARIPLHVQENTAFGGAPCAGRGSVRKGTNPSACCKKVSLPAWPLATGSRLRANIMRVQRKNNYSKFVGAAYYEGVGSEGA